MQYIQGKKKIPKVRRAYGPTGLPLFCAVGHAQVDRVVGQEAQGEQGSLPELGVRRILGVVARARHPLQRRPEHDRSRLLHERGLGEDGHARRRLGQHGHAALRGGLDGRWHDHVVAVVDRPGRRRQGLRWPARPPRACPSSPPAHRSVFSLTRIPSAGAGERTHHRSPGRFSGWCCSAACVVVVSQPLLPLLPMLTPGPWTPPLRQEGSAGSSSSPCPSLCMDGPSPVLAGFPSATLRFVRPGTVGATTRIGRTLRPRRAGFQTRLRRPRSTPSASEWPSLRVCGESSEQGELTGVTNERRRAGCDREPNWTKLLLRVRSHATN